MESIKESVLFGISDLQEFSQEFLDLLTNEQEETREYLTLNYTPRFNIDSQ
jgi:hypothetical protein